MRLISSRGVLSPLRVLPVGEGGGRTTPYLSPLTPGPLFAAISAFGRERKGIVSGEALANFPNGIFPQSLLAERL